MFLYYPIPCKGIQGKSEGNFEEVQAMTDQARAVLQLKQAYRAMMAARQSLRASVPSSHYIMGAADEVTEMLGDLLQYTLDEFKGRPSTPADAADFDDE